ncbi:MAG TPA: diacylglycerol kinase family protein [Candidatus Saccharimonadales bacterium]|nr:diacylglycerol kinase family protein [Candidatus Saccharimonadales bacterium]
MVELGPELTPFEPQKGQRLLIFSNPASKQAKTIKPAIKEFHETAESLGYKVEEHRTQKELEYMVDALEVAEEGDLLGIVSGDGGTTHFQKAVVAREMDNAVLVIGGGDANDQARNLHKKENVRKPFKLLQDPEARIGHLHPLEVTIGGWTQDKLQQDLAFGYVGIGITALIGDQFNTQEFRKQVMSYRHAVEARRLAYILRVGLPQIPKTPILTISEAGRDDVVAIERNITNGPHEAKFFKFPGMASLVKDAGAFDMPVLQSVTNSRPGRTEALLSGAMKAMRGHLEHFGTGQKREFSVKSDSGQIPVQVDGEASFYNSNANFSIGISDKSVRVVTTLSDPLAV